RFPSVSACEWSGYRSSSTVTPAVAAASITCWMLFCRSASIEAGCVSSQRIVSAFIVSPSAVMVGMKKSDCDASYLASSLTPTIRLAEADPGRRTAAASASAASVDLMETCVPGGSVDPGEHRVGEPVGPEAYRVVGGEAGFLLGLGNRGAGALLVDVAGVERERHDLGGAGDQRRAFVELDELRERRDREPLVAVDEPLPGEVAEDERVRGAAVEKPERHARVGRVQQRALAFDPEKLAATLDPLEDELLG